MRTTGLLLALLAVPVLGGRDGSKVPDAPRPGYVPSAGFVPTAEVAIRIAVAVWEPIYGVEHIAREKPYAATLTDGVWSVRGTLPPGMLGGVAEAEIARADGRVLRVLHGK